MKTRTTKAVAATALTALSLMLAGGAEAALVERLGGKAIYDDVADLTWLQDANYAKTSGYDADGRMPWVQANAWAGSLNIDGVTGWRLPGGTMVAGSTQTASEMGNLFFNVLGGTAGSSITATHNDDYNLFKNVQSSRGYYSGVESSASNAWVFYFYSSFQNAVTKSLDRYAWAVRSGDVAASPVPVPGALALMGPALLGLLGVKRSRRRA